MRRSIPFILTVSFLISLVGCSSNSESVTENSTINTMENSVNTTEHIDFSDEFIDEREVITLEFELVDDRLCASYENITFDVQYPSVTPESVNIYQIAVSDSPNLEGYYNGNVASGEYDWDMSFPDYDNAVYQPLFDTQSLRWSYEMYDTHLSFWDFILLNRVNNLEISEIDEICSDCIEALNFDLENYYSRCMHNTVLLPDGTVRNNYSIPQQIDDIPLFNGRLYPQYSSHLDFVNIDGEVMLVSVLSGRRFTMYNENYDCCNLDQNTYEIVDTVEENVSIIPLEECITNVLPDIGLEGHRDTYVYLADLCYVVVNPIDVDNNEISDISYTIPCWVLFYTAWDGSIEGGEVDGIVAINAITGDNIDIDDYDIFNYLWPDV